MSDKYEQQRPVTTNDAGIPVSSNEYSVTVGPDGLVLLQDSYLIEKMAQFNRERVHAEDNDFVQAGNLYRDVMSALF